MKKYIPKTKTPFLFPLKSLSNKQQIFFLLHRHFNRCQQLPAPYKWLYPWRKRNRQTDLLQTNLIWLTVGLIWRRIDGSKPTNDWWQLYTSLTANTIIATLTNHFQRSRFITPSTDKHYSLNSEDDFCSSFLNVSHQK